MSNDLASWVFDLLCGRNPAMPLTLHATELEALHALWFCITPSWCQGDQLNSSSPWKGFILQFRQCDVKLKEADEQTPWGYKAGPGEGRYMDVSE